MKINTLLTLGSLLMITCSALAQYVSPTLPWPKTGDDPNNIGIFLPHTDKDDKMISLLGDEVATRAADIPIHSDISLGDDGMYLLDEDTASVIVLVELDNTQFDMISSSSYTTVLQDISKKIYQKFNDDFDYIFFVLDGDKFDHASMYGFYGMNIGISNSVAGIGISNYSNASNWGSAGKLKSAIYFPFPGAIADGPGLHEVLHTWGAYICPTFDFNNSSAGGHWGVSNAGGQLGGFRYVRKVEDNSNGVAGRTKYQASFNSNERDANGSFIYGGFGTAANGGNSLPYSDIELYLMGMKSAQELKNANFRLDIYSDNSYDNATVSNGYFYSRQITSYSIDDIIRMLGERLPNVTNSQKQFKVLTVVLSHRKISFKTFNSIIDDIHWFGGPVESNRRQSLFNFSQATNGKGSLVVAGIKNSLKQTVTNQPFFGLPTSLNLDFISEERNYNFISNTKWTVSSSESWLSISPTSGSNSGTMTFKASGNPHSVPRTAIVTVSGTGSPTLTINVIQEGNEMLNDLSWDLSSAVTATLTTEGILTITGGFGMPDYGNYPPWIDMRRLIHTAVLDANDMPGRPLYQCNNLTSVVISNKVGSRISTPFFVGCDKLTSIQVDQENRNWSSEDGVLYNKDKSILSIFPSGKTGAFTIPASVKTIASYSFSSSLVSEVIIPASVTTINDLAFVNCKNLTSLIIPNSVTRISRPFYGSFLKFVTIPASITTMYTNVFENTPHLKEVTVEWTTPLVFTPYLSGSFIPVVKNVTLRVPTGTKALYQKAEIWKDFGNIVEYEPVGNEEIQALEVQSALHTFAVNGILYVSGLQYGKLLSIYSINGQLVYKSVAKSETEQIPFNLRGNYIVVSGNQIIKTIVK